MGLLYEVDASGNATYYHYDHLGSTVAMTDDSSAVTDRVEYAPYGQTTYRTGTIDTPFLFNGRYGVVTDANGLLYMRARYYNPYIRRFINQDPIKFSGGLNWFAYADGNPVSLLDPFGLAASNSLTFSETFKAAASGAWEGLQGAGLIVAGFIPYVGDGFFLIIEGKHIPQHRQ